MDPFGDNLEPIDVPSKPSVYKKRPAPVPVPVPVPVPKDRATVCEPTTVERSTINSDLTKVIGKLNPVREMQILARNNSNNDVRSARNPR